MQTPQFDMPDVTDNNLQDICRRLGLSNMSKQRVKRALSSIPPCLYQKLNPIEEGNKLEMQTRQYEIELATMHYMRCDCCSRHFLGDGAIKSSKIDKRKFFYRNNQIVQKKYKSEREEGDE